MQLQERINTMVKLGEKLKEKDEYLEAIMLRTKYNNGWFTLENQRKSIDNIRDFYLDEKMLLKWVAPYNIPERTIPKNVGIVMAGNIPLVGFHDLLSVFVAGHRCVIKLSEKDQFLLPYFLKILKEIDSRTEGYFLLANRLKNIDAVIATGSNNSSRYFEYYFSKMPNIIRKNRNAVAALSGQETPEELLRLGNDVFQYFGLGCRNVSKVYVPQEYEFEPLMEALHEYREIVRHNKYKNNFDYNFAIQVLNKNTYKSNGCVLVTENKAISSRVGELYYEHYIGPKELERELNHRAEEIQCVVAKAEFLKLPTIPFGEAQKPQLWDYADGVDTMSFLLEAF